MIQHLKLSLFYRIWICLVLYGSCYHFIGNRLRNWYVFWVAENQQTTIALLWVSFSDLILKTRFLWYCSMLFYILYKHAVYHTYPAMEYFIINHMVSCRSIRSFELQWMIIVNFDMDTCICYLEEILCSLIWFLINHSDIDFFKLDTIPQGSNFSWTLDIYLETKYNQEILRSLDS